MKKRLNTWFFALVMAIAGGAPLAVAQETPPMSPAQLQKILQFVDTAGVKQMFPPPTAHDLGLTDDWSKALPVTMVVTTDTKVYFIRSELNPNDYIVWLRGADDETSIMFLTHPRDLKLASALYLRLNDFPQTKDVNSAPVQAEYKKALTALAKDFDKRPLPNPTH
jgi:hypothetical protein